MTVGSFIECRAEPVDSAHARWCLTQYFEDLNRLFNGGFDVARGNSLTNADMTPPRGVLLLAWRASVPVGCGVLVRIDDNTGEIKRMWVAPEARGQGIAGTLLRRLEDEAKAWGFTRIRLDTNRALTLARNMYRRAGYRDILRYNENPYAHHWFEKQV